MCSTQTKTKITAGDMIPINKAKPAPKPLKTFNLPCIVNIPFLYTYEAQKPKKNILS